MTVTGDLRYHRCAVLVSAENLFQPRAVKTKSLCARPAQQQTDFPQELVEREKKKTTIVRFRRFISAAPKKSDFLSNRLDYIKNSKENKSLRFSFAGCWAWTQSNRLMRHITQNIIVSNHQVTFAYWGMTRMFILNLRRCRDSHCCSFDVSNTELGSSFFLQCWDLDIWGIGGPNKTSAVPVYCAQIKLLPSHVKLNCDPFDKLRLLQAEVWTKPGYVPMSGVQMHLINGLRETQGDILQVVKHHFN